MTPILLASVVALLGQEPSSEALERAILAQGAEKGALFSAVPMAGTELGRRWGALRPAAAARFPALRLKTLPDLHITVVYLGKGWRIADLGRLREEARLPLKAPVTLQARPARLGRRGQVVALELLGVPEAVQAEVVAAKARLNAAGLKPPDAYDGAFRAHVTLAELPEGTPAEAQVQELEGFLGWIAGALDLPTLAVRLGPETPTQLLLSGATRPPGTTGYLPVEAFLAQWGPGGP